MAQFVNPNAEVIGKSQALTMNCSAAKGLQAVVKTNLGPKGTMKMYADHVHHMLLFILQNQYLIPRCPVFFDPLGLFLVLV